MNIYKILVWPSIRFLSQAFIGNQFTNLLFLSQITINNNKLFHNKQKLVADRVVLKTRVSVFRSLS